MSVVHLHGKNDEINFFIDFMKKTLKKEFIVIKDFREALAKLNPKYSYIFPNFVKSERYQIYCRSSKFKMHHITIVFGDMENPEAPREGNKFDVPLLKIEKKENTFENKFTEEDISIIKNALKL